jgi:signal peptidase I
LAAKLKKLWKNEYVQTAAIIGIIVLIFFSIWFSATLALNTPNPVVVVPTGSMCIPYDGACDGWSHPFARTLHVGDLLILQGVNPKDLNTNYPYSDIIVFHQATNPDDLIVHRIAAVDEINGTLYFHTKGDGNSVVKWPETPPSDYYDGLPIEPPAGVAQDKVVGRVIFRIPWIGNVVLFMRTTEGKIFVVVLVALLIIIEFVLPGLRKIPTQVSPEPQQQQQHETPS